MRISIKNFKAIKSLENFELRPLTILSGVNSSGKSSFIQLILLLKQTLDLDSARNHLVLKGDLYDVNSFKDIVAGKDLSNKIKVTFEFSKEEDLAFSSESRITYFDSFASFILRVEVAFDFFSGKEYISDFTVSYVLPSGDKNELFVKFRTRRGKDERYIADSNSTIFGEKLWGRDLTLSDLSFLSIFPNSYEITEVEVVSGAEDGDVGITNTSKKRHFPKMDGIKALINNTFGAISYIGPLRDQPLDEYSHSDIRQGVGKKGEYTAQILEIYSSQSIEYFKPTVTSDGIEYSLEKSSLLDAVRVWICKVFGIADNIYAKKQSDSYSIFLVNEFGLETTIKHVGFGISQVLPIIVEGLRLAPGTTLILEQPEIHLHPKLQSLLFDFLYSLVLNGRKIIIETHSDHFITRMRRRVAEDSKSEMQNNINLTFIESGAGELYFGTIELDNFGTLDYFPENFIAETSQEMKAIIKAQMKKRSVKND